MTRLDLWAGALVAALLCCACDYAAKWRDAQVAESHKLAQGDRITPPVRPPAKAADFVDDLPVEKAWPVLEYSEKGDNVRTKLLSTRDAEQTTLFVDQRLRDLGYASGDNISRLLEGASYSGKGKYSLIMVRVTMNSTGQVTVELTGAK